MPSTPDVAPAMPHADLIEHEAARRPSEGRTRLRLAALIATSEISGPGRQLVALGREIQRRGADFFILALMRPGADNAFVAFARAQGIACREVTDRGPFDPQLVGEVRNFIEEWRPDVVQTHSYKPTSVLYILRKLGVPCAWIGFHEGATDKGFKDRLYTRLDFLMLGAADRVVVMSQKQKQMFPARIDRVRVVANAVPEMPRVQDAARIPTVLRRRRGEGPVPLVGVIGRLSREKGVDVFLDALALLKARGVAVRGVIVGDGALRAGLEEQARRLGIAADVEFAGRVEAMLETYEALDLMVIPSRSEGLPSALLEALQTGLPVVTTRVGAMIEIAAEEPASMRMVPSEQPERLAEAIEAELADIEAPEAAAARARVASAYSIGKRCDHMLRIYDEALIARGIA